MLLSRLAAHSTVPTDSGCRRLNTPPSSASCVLRPFHILHQGGAGRMGGCGCGRAAVAAAAAVPCLQQACRKAVPRSRLDLDDFTSGAAHKAAQRAPPGGYQLLPRGAPRCVC